MDKFRIGTIGRVSKLSLGGGGIGQVWGRTTHKESVATVIEAIQEGINLLDVAPMYGQGEAERVIGSAFNGKLPPETLVSTKCLLRNPLNSQVPAILESSLNDSLARMKLERTDIFFLHGYLTQAINPSTPSGTSRKLFIEIVRPSLEKLITQGRIGAWGITGIGEPDSVLKTLVETPRPAVVQAISNMLDSPGGLKFFDGPSKAREIIETANKYNIAVMGIRALQAGALTRRFDRKVEPTHLDMQDYRKAEKFRDLARDIGESPTSLALRYSIYMKGVSTLVIGAKNRLELRECLSAEREGPLPKNIVDAIDASIK